MTTKEATACRGRDIYRIKSFWFSTSPLKSVGDALNKLVPDQGPVLDAEKNRALEKFRKATNCYHDLYNNGMGNRNAEFRQVFGFSAFSEEATAKAVEARMNEIVLAAAAEQKLPIVVAQMLVA